MHNSNRGATVGIGLTRTLPNIVKALAEQCEWLFTFDGLKSAGRPWAEK